MPAHTVTLATFPLPDRDGTYWQVSVDGQPVTRETESQPEAAAWYRRTCAQLSMNGRTVHRKFWDGYNAQETPLGN